MSKPVRRGRRESTPIRVRSGESPPHARRAVRDPLVRLLETPHLGPIVPTLRPETLQQIIRLRGLDACGELVASATHEQLTAVFDLDLWRKPQPRLDEQFDVQRFGEWLELLVEIGTSAAADTVAAMDPNLVVAGLSRSMDVFDVAGATPST
jgi:hypothetical protein